MSDVKILVNDFLLRELSAETRKIGSRVLVKATEHLPEFTADIMDVIILPHSEFYRFKFTGYYKLFNHNSVKALKELSKHFPFIPDFELGIGYLLNLGFSQENSSSYDPIKISRELEWLKASSFQQNCILQNTP